MARIGNVPGILEVKNRLTELQERGLIDAWALPYENVLTRLDAAIFFLTPTREDALEEIWSELCRIPGLNYQQNVDKKLSDLSWQVQFTKLAATG